MQQRFRTQTLLLAGTALLVGTLSVTGCQTIPEDALALSPESLEQRSLQTRRYDNTSEPDLLIASAGVIQDLGFNIDESETELGVIVGSKDRDATEAGQIAGAILVAALTGTAVPIDKNQKLRVSLVVKPAESGIKGSYLVRVTFQRIVWNTQNQVSKIEALDDPEYYQGFFDRLSKAVFLEAHKI